MKLQQVNVYIAFKVITLQGIYEGGSTDTTSN